MTSDFCTNDPDLKFLDKCSNEDLILLCDLITKNKKGNARFTELLTIKETYKNYYPNNMKVLIPEIINELQEYGGNTFANFFRGHGVRYRKIVLKVCKAQKVNYNKSTPTDTLEYYLLQKILVTSISNMNDRDVKHINGNASKEDLMKEIGSIKAGSPVFLKLTMVAVQQIAEKSGVRWLGEGVAKLLGTKFYNVAAGPIGWAVSIAWSFIDIAGPAMRVMFPATVAIAYLRMKCQNNDEELTQFI